MYPYIELSEIDVTNVRKMVFGKKGLTIHFNDSSSIVIENVGSDLEYDYLDSDGKQFSICV